MAVPNIFASATAAIPLSQLDTNFATAITLGNTAVYLGNTTTSLGNVTLTNVTISSGNVSVTGANVSGTANVSTLIVTGNATIDGTTTTIQGITFPATQVASPNANTLDDYEEGTWTGTFTNQTNMSGATWSSGSYTKIGRFVTLNGQFTCTVTSSNVLTYVVINGLPFTSAIDSVGAAFLNDNVKVGVSQVAGGSNLYPFFPAASAVVAGSEIIQFCVTYRVN